MSHRTTSGADDGSPDTPGTPREQDITPGTRRLNARLRALRYRMYVERDERDAWQRACRPPGEPEWKRHARMSRWYRHRHTGQIWHAWYLPSAHCTRWSHWPTGDLSQPPAGHDFVSGRDIDTCPAGAVRITRPDPHTSTDQEGRFR